MASGLLSHIYYGHELDQFYKATAQIRKWFASETPGGTFEWGAVEAVANEFFRRKYEGVFGGQITAGDGISIMAFMAALRPTSMIEIGVASGYSSAFILYCAKKFQLLSDNPFLYSFDIVKETASGAKTGAFAFKEYPELVGHWELRTEVTSLDLIRTPDNYLPERVRNGRTIAFIDGGHNHPWPLADIVALRRVLPAGSWLVLQDAQMMERWIADTVIHGVPCPQPVRGVNLVISLWPGRKQIGMGINYNTSAICFDASDEQFREFVKTCLVYEDEIGFKDHALLLQASQADQLKPSTIHRPMPARASEPVSKALM